jgi:hypothetical protein
VVKRELEKVGERTGAILAQAEESAQQIRAEAEDEARGTVNTANMEATEARTEADRYSSETRGSADSYARQTRQEADEEAASTRANAEQRARETIEAAEARARRIVEEGTQRREDIEAVIADLIRRRDDVLTDTEELSAKLTAAVSQHRSATGEDGFDKPDELDPLARDAPDEELTEDTQLVEGQSEAPPEGPESEREPDLRT